MEHAIELRDVRKTFGANLAVDAVSLAVPRSPTRASRSGTRAAAVSRGTPLSCARSVRNAPTRILRYTPRSSGR